MIWFLSFLAYAMAIKDSGIEWLGIFWPIYLADLWLEQSRISDTIWLHTHARHDSKPTGIRALAEIHP